MVEILDAWEKIRRRTNLHCRCYVLIRWDIKKDKSVIKLEMTILPYRNKKWLMYTFATFIILMLTQLVEIDFVKFDLGKYLIKIVKL